VERLPPQPSVPSSDFNVHIVFHKVNALVLIILFLILFHMIILLPLFASLPCLSPLYLYPGYMRRLYWYLLGVGYRWGNECSYFSRNLGVGLSTQRCCGLSISLYLEVSPWWFSGWYKARLVAKGYTKRPMAWTTLRLFHQLFGWTPFEFFFLLLLIWSGPYFN